MQLKNKPAITQILAAATCTLLSSPCHAVSAQTDNDINANVSMLYYSEVERVDVNKVLTQAEKNLTELDSVKVGFVYDTMTGASPNGRIRPINNATTNTSTIPVTSASGFAYDVNSQGENTQGDNWLTEFTDTRVAFNGEWGRQIFSSIKSQIGVSYSTENDYTSKGASANLLWDVNQKRTTLNFGASAYDDEVSPKGGIPEGLAKLECSEAAGSDPNRVPEWISCNDKVTRFKPGDKKIFDYLLGLTQVWNRFTLFQLNYTRGVSTGYLTDPYKQISILETLHDGEIQNTQEVAVLYESRPSERNRNSLYWKLVHNMNENVMRFSYRYFWDDWGVKSHTLSLRYRFQFHPKHFLQPHIRYNRQSEADFFRESIDKDDVKPKYATADHRLGKQNTLTLGLKYATDQGKRGEFGVRAELMKQRYSSSDLPAMLAYIVQATMKFKF